jgi:hypothetical protein
MFGKDTVDRFIGMITFSDGKPSKAEETVSKAGFKIDKFFKFNNRVMFERYNDVDKEALLSYSKAQQGFTDFFQYVKTSQKVPISLKLTKQVIQQREFIA